MTAFPLLNAAKCGVLNGSNGSESCDTIFLPFRATEAEHSLSPAGTQDSLPLPVIVLRQDAGEAQCLTCSTCQTHEWQLVDDGTQAEWLCRCVVCGADNEQVEGGGLL